MSYVEYTAKRRIISGHTAETTYQMDFSSTTLNQSLNIAGSRSVALDGTTEGVLDYVADVWGVTTAVVEAADLPQWYEFLASVAAAESFTFDAYGTSGSPDNAQTVILDGTPSISRIDMLTKYQVTFNARVL